jgi:hypothetical protein
MRRAVVLAVLLVSFLVSCQKENSFEGDPSRRCVACSYLPLCDSSVFTYVDSANTIDTLRGTVRIGTDTTIAGQSYSRVTGFAAFPNGLMYNCSGGDYKTLLYLSDFGLNADSLEAQLLQLVQLPIPLPPGVLNLPSSFRTSFLNTNVPVNGNWVDTIYSLNFPPLLSVFAGLKYTIREKGISKTLFQRTYTNVIHVQGETQFTSTLGAIPLPSLKLDYYFSENVGIIQTQIRRNDTLTRDTKLYQYRL